MCFILYNSTTTKNPLDLQATKMHAQAEPLEVWSFHELLVGCICRPRLDRASLGNLSKKYGEQDFFTVSIFKSEVYPPTFTIYLLPNV